MHLALNCRKALRYFAGYGTPPQICYVASHYITLQYKALLLAGYGNAPPKTPGGRAFCMIFALIGIPLLLISGLGIGYMMINGAERLRKTCIRHAGPKDAVKVHILRTVIIFVVSIVLLVLIPAAILTVLEKKWTYGDAIYFCLTTVLTIGFGDFVPGENDSAYTFWLHPYTY